jgi:hypothetical protein
LASTLEIALTQRESGSFFDFITENDMLASGLYSNRLRSWEKVFGKEHLSVWKYAPELFYNKNIAEFFLNQFDIELPLDAKTSNLGAHPYLNEAYRRVASEDRLSSSKQEHIRKKLFEIGAMLPRTSSIDQYLKPTELKLLQQYFLPSNTYLKKHFGIDFSNCINSESIEAC